MVFGWPLQWSLYHHHYEDATPHARTTPLGRGNDTVGEAEVGVAITVGAFRRPKANRKVEACQNRARGSSAVASCIRA
jgi:hypothetical protein